MQGTIASQLSTAPVRRLDASSRLKWPPMPWREHQTATKILDFLLAVKGAFEFTGGHTIAINTLASLHIIGSGVTQQESPRRSSHRAANRLPLRKRGKQKRGKDPPSNPYACV